jgi:hypothetical protein
VLVLDPGRPFDELRDAPGHAVGAYDGGEDEDVIADPDGSVSPSIAHDGHVFHLLHFLHLLSGLRVGRPGARYYTTFGGFHQLDDKKGLPFRIEA